MNLYANVLAALRGESKTDDYTVGKVAPNGIELIAWRDNWRDSGRVLLGVEHEYIDLPPQLAQAVRAELLG